MLFVVCCFLLFVVGFAVGVAVGGAAGVGVVVGVGVVGVGVDVVFCCLRLSEAAPDVRRNNRKAWQKYSAGR